MPTSSKILDVPVGTGRFFEIYARGGHQVLGVDVSSDMLDQAMVAREAHRAANITLEAGDITALDLEADSFDVGVCIRLFNLVEAAVAEQAMRELARVATSHLIVGVRSHGRAGSVRRTARRARSALRRRPDKLTIHSDATVQRLFEAAGATTLDRCLVATGAHNSSEYYIYLLSLAS